MARHGTWLSLACGAQPFWLLLIAFGALVFTVSTSTDADRDTAHEARAISSARLSAALRERAVATFEGQWRDVA
jgi:hypothetical protein